VNETATLERRAGAAWRLPVQAIAHTVIEVSDLARARAFYGELLGLRAAPIETWPDADEVALPLLSGQNLVLRRVVPPRTAPNTGVHRAYRASPASIERIVQSLTAHAVTVHRHHEDRPTEQSDACYFADPDGNRIQLARVESTVGPGIIGIDHTAVQASDMEWIEEFYGDRLGLAVDHRVGWNTADYIRARAWGEGKDDMAPGCRRWDERYRDIPGGKPGQGRRVPRPNMQIFFRVGDGILGVYMALAHEQEPPLRLAKGTPRTGYLTSRAALDETAAAFAGTRVAMVGPVEHPARSPIAASLYIRDPCGNFIELCAPRQEGT
jgi:catechol 2,3-dioxygenase-like lactoylglutathione lyase family enzyme